MHARLFNVHFVINEICKLIRDAELLFLSRSDHFNMEGVLYQQPVVPSDMNSIMNNNNIGCSGYEEVYFKMFLNEFLNQCKVSKKTSLTLQFYSSSLMSHEDVPGAQGQAYRPRQGTLLHDGYNLNYSQIGVIPLKHFQKLFLSILFVFNCFYRSCNATGSSRY